MKKRVVIFANTVLILLLVGYSIGCRSEEAGGGMDIVLFLQNPVVMIIGAIIIVYFMMKRSK